MYDEDAVDPQLPIAVSGVSMAKHLDSMPTDNDVAPNVEGSVAETVERAWNRTHREDVKELFLKNKRPQNTPSLAKVTLDEALDAGLSEKFPRAKRADAVLNSVNNAIVKAAVALTHLLDNNMTSVPSSEAMQAASDKATEAIKMLAYGNAQLHQARREHLKNLLDPSVKSQLVKGKHLTQTNTSHQLFGGDIQKRAKEG